MGHKRVQRAEKVLAAIVEDIQRILWKTFPRITDQQQEEIAQEVKLKFWKMLTGGRDIKHLRSYLWKVVYTTALDVVDEKADLLPLDEEVEMQSLNPISELGGLSSDSRLERKEAEGRLMTAIESLSANRRLVLKLHLTGMDIRETAEFMGWSVSKVNHLYYRGLDDLKKSFGTREKGPQ